MAARIFAVLAALLLVAAVAIGTLTPPGLTLGQRHGDAGSRRPDLATRAQRGVAVEFVEVPFMIRPLWLIPACLGLICAGMAATLNLGSALPPPPPELTLPRFYACPKQPARDRDDAVRLIPQPVALEPIEGREDRRRHVAAPGTGSPSSHDAAKSRIV